MTMHLARGYSTLNTRKPQQKKRTAAQQEKLIEEHRLYNKRMRQAGRHSERMTFEEYVDYVYGKKKISTRQEHLDPTTIKTYTPPAPRFTRETGQYASLETSSNTIPAQPAKKEYTGTLVKGIATMHKSNAVPVLGEDDATDIAHMRR